tara:strand:- start:334 stop:1392 length:1059 start_codon:yes stop_codon:yes gene_type:complete
MSTDEIRPLLKDKCGRTTVFVSPAEGKDVLVRTGTSEMSTFLYSCLCCTSREYNAMSNSDKEAYLSRFRTIVFERMTREDWENRLDEDERIFSVSSCFGDLICDFHEFVHNKREPDEFTCFETRELLKSVLMSEGANDIKTYQTILELLSLDEICTATETARTRTGLLEDHEFCLTSCIVEKIEQNQIMTEVPKETYTKIVRLLGNLISSTHAIAVEVAVKRYNEQIEFDSDIDSRSKAVILTKLRRNAYIIDAKTRYPVDVIEPSSDRKRKAIGVLRFNIDGVYRYEPIGILQEHNRIQREYEMDEGIVMRFEKFLDNPADAEDMLISDRDYSQHKRKLPEGSPVRNNRAM